MPIGQSAAREGQGEIEERLHRGRPEHEIMRLREQRARAGLAAGLSQITCPIVEQTRVASGFSRHRSILRFDVGGAQLERDPRIECGASTAPAPRHHPLRIGGLPTDQQGIDPLVEVRKIELAREALHQRRLVIGGEVRLPERRARRDQRIGRTAARGQRLRQAREAITRGRRGRLEEADHRHRRLARPHRLLGRAPQCLLVGPARVGHDEARIVGEGVARASPEPPPVGQRIVDVAVRRIGGHARRRLQRDQPILHRRRRSGDDEDGEDDCNAPHAGHLAGVVLIRR